MRSIIATQKAPAAVGPYSQAVVANGLVFCSGQIGLDPETGDFAGETMATQAEQCLKNLSAVLSAAGSGFDKVVKVTVYLTDMNDFSSFNVVYERYFSVSSSAGPPARACVAVAALPKGALVEMELIAVI